MSHLRVWGTVSHSRLCKVKYYDHLSIGQASLPFVGTTLMSLANEY
jgi:hypothetical protein